MTDPVSERAAGTSRAGEPAVKPRPVTASEDPASASKRKVGRPPRIDRTAIADAVLELGLEHSSMKSVAEHLGVSVPGLYHHIRNRKELLLLAAERSLSQLRPPRDRGQHWSEWLREWGRYSRQAFVDEPEIFAQYLRGAISVEVMVEVEDSVIRVLAAHGFAPHDALAAWSAVGRLAVGAAVDAIRWQAATDAGHSQLAELRRVLGERPPGDLPGIRAALDTSASGLEDQFEQDMTTLLAGIAVRRGEPVEPIVARTSSTGRKQAGR